MSKLARSFGQHVRRERKRRGLSQDQLAKLARTTQKSISEAESGLCNPNLLTMERLAKVLKFKITWSEGR